MTLITANALTIPLADKSVHCIVTSPPYWSLRDYDTVDQIGLENIHDCQGWATGDNCGLCYICQMRAVMRECWRVLRDDATCWVNLGDSYSSGHNVGSTDDKEGWSHGSISRGVQAHGSHAPGLKPKDLCMIPARFALAAQADGWYLRSDIIWSKPNPMPESVTDRPTKAHEYLFLLAKSARYFYDADAIREEAQPQSIARINQPNFVNQKGGPKDYKNGVNPNRSMRQTLENFALNPGRNRRTVWNIATQATPFAHFATFPEKLVVPCIKAGTSEYGVCAECGAPWERVVERTTATPGQKPGYTMAKSTMRNDGERAGHFTDHTATTAGWRPTCEHDAPTVPATVLDPFAGSGTTGLVARKHGRRFIGLDLSFDYLQNIARRRLSLDALDEWSNGVKASEVNTEGLPLFSGVPQ